MVHFPEAQQRCRRFFFFFCFLGMWHGVWGLVGHVDPFRQIGKCCASLSFSGHFGRVVANDLGWTSIAGCHFIGRTLGCGQQICVVHAWASDLGIPTGEEEEARAGAVFAPRSVSHPSHTFRRLIDHAQAKLCPQCRSHPLQAEMDKIFERAGRPALHGQPATNARGARCELVYYH